MRRAKYDMRQVICKNSSIIGYSSNIAKPGHWVMWRDIGFRSVGRVIGRIAETDRGGENCAGYIAVMRLTTELTHAMVAWVNPLFVTHCYAQPPQDLLTWITGSEWVRSKADIARLVAMAQHGTTADQYIANRDNPEQPYNCRPEYVQQFILGGTNALP